MGGGGGMVPPLTARATPHDIDEEAPAHGPPADSGRWQRCRTRQRCCNCVAPTKQSLLVALLGQTGGVPVSAIAEATGWQAHTVRAALTGLRKKGHTIVRSKVEGASRYTIAPEAAP